MTREEAIEHGKEQLEIFGGEHRKFIELAIEALYKVEEQTHYIFQLEAERDMFRDMVSEEPCEDAISRKEAKTLVSKLDSYNSTYKPFGDTERNIETVSKDDVLFGLDVLTSVQPKMPEYEDAISRKAVVDIFKLPSVQPKSRWIPCSEQPPEESGDYLLYRPHFWGANIGQITVCYFNGKEWSDNYKNDAERFLPIIYGMAWMPLPEAYKGEE